MLEENCCSTRTEWLRFDWVSKLSAVAVVVVAVAVLAAVDTGQWAVGDIGWACMCQLHP